MSNLSDLNINSSAEASEVLANDTAVKTYLQSIQHKDKVAPWAVWTETYYIPYAGRIQEGIDQGHPGLITRNLPYIKGYVPEASGRRFLGGDVHVVRSSKLKPLVESDDGAQVSSSGDKMMIHMQRTATEGGSEFLTSSLLTDGAGVSSELPGYFSEKAQKLEDANKVRFLCYPRLYSNEPTMRNNSLELPADSNYIGTGEYWFLFFEPLAGITTPTGKSTDVGWYGVTVNLKFGSLLEA